MSEILSLTSLSLYTRAMELMRELESGNTRFGTPDRIIESILSKIFIFKKRAIKVYKHRKTFYGDMGNVAFRKRFYEEDFGWNHIAAPDLYVKLLRMNNDWAIEMRTIDTQKNLANLLQKGAIHSKAIVAIITQLSKRTASLTNKRRVNLKKYFDAGLLKLRHQSLDDLSRWLGDMHPHIPHQVSTKAIAVLKNAAKGNVYFKEFPGKKLAATMDTNTDNILYVGRPDFIDIMPPKESWRVNDPQFCIVRVAVDACVLGSKEIHSVVNASREKMYGVLPQTVLLQYEIHAALIQWAYQHALKQHRVAKKYRAYVLPKLAELERYAASEP